MVAALMLVVCWIVATLNPSILGMIESLGGPIIAVLLFLMPMYAIRRVPSMRKYSGAAVQRVRGGGRPGGPDLGGVRPDR
jgi:serine transporter